MLYLMEIKARYRRMKKLLFIILIAIMINNSIKFNKEFEIEQQNKRIAEREAFNSFIDSIIGDYIMEWHGEEIKLSISKQNYKMIDKGETFEIVYGDYTVCRITYKGETTKAHFTSLDDKPMINVETNDSGYGLYFIERLSSGNLYLKLFDATYIAVVDDEIVMKKIAE